MAHVVVFPLPAQGHINCMLKLAELLSVSGLTVTFLNTAYNDGRLRRFSAAYEHLSRSPNFIFGSIPDGLSDDESPSSALAQFWQVMQSNSAKESFRDILVSSQEKRVPPVTCIISDGIMTFPFDVAEELGIPVIGFRTASACSLWCFMCISKLAADGENPFAGTESDLDELIRGVPGMESFLRHRDFPRFSAFTRVGEIGNSNNDILRVIAGTAYLANRSKGFILNSSECLEGPVLSHIRSVCRPNVYTIGPLHALHRSYVNNDIELVSSSMRKEDRSCMEWLDAQPLRSVVYVSFGSITTVKREDLLEFWHGLVNSGHKFLWVIRPDLVAADTAENSRYVPVELEKATEERGLLVEWVPQTEVLDHPAVGAFLSHAGWNSTLESIVAGVPMICWPFFGDQQINSRFIGEIWKVGLDMKDQCDRKVVEKMVKEAMEGETAEELKRNAVEMAEKMRRSVGEGGTSYDNLEKLVHLIRMLSSESSINSS